MDEVFELLGNIIMDYPREEWVDKISKHVVHTNDATTIQVGNNHLDIPSLNYFDKNYIGKFNIGSYVTISPALGLKENGYFRIVTLPYLDTRWQKYWYTKEEDPNGLSNIEQIIMKGSIYGILGIDLNLEKTGTYFFDNCSSSSFGMFIDSNYLDDQHLIEFTPSEDIKSKINEIVYSFDYEPEIYEQLKATE